MHIIILKLQVWGGQAVLDLYLFLAEVIERLNYLLPLDLNEGPGAHAPHSIGGLN